MPDTAIISRLSGKEFAILLPECSLQTARDLAENVRYQLANANNDHLRKYLFANDWIIIDEQMVKDAGHIYEVMVVTARQNKAITYNRKDEEFGPILINNQTPLFKEKWQNSIKFMKRFKIHYHMIIRVIMKLLIK